MEAAFRRRKSLYGREVGSKLRTMIPRIAERMLEMNHVGTEPWFVGTFGAVKCEECT